jgi:primosomal protein N' (replication factor Y) (superfamily II helicase)
MTAKDTHPIWVEVLVDSPGATGLYTYAVPVEFSLRSGDILMVPFGPQQVSGIALQILRQLPADLDPRKVRSVESVTRAGFFPPVARAAVIQWLGP